MCVLSMSQTLSSAQTGRDFAADAIARVRAGLALLQGEVPHLAARERALAWARALRGVREVDDQLVISAPFPDPPLALVEALEEEFYRSYALEPGEVDVVASEGTVTLRGTVDSAAERILIRRAAASMSGVRELEDELEVAAPRTRPDMQVSAEILALLEHDLLVPAEQLEVRVRSGVARIEGLVPSQRVAARLVEVAALAGARDLDLTALRVEPALRDPALREG